MNIFILDEDPKVAAQYHCDKHVIKMILETAQLLSTCCRYYGIDYGYKSTHLNHPCSIWLRQGFQNVLWTYKLGLFLLQEYTKRYNKIHKSSEIIINIPLDDLRKFMENKRTDFVLAMPEQYKSENAVISYRNYYINEKASFATWKNTSQPKWMQK